MGAAEARAQAKEGKEAARQVAGERPQRAARTACRGLTTT
jgi:hypothetical protein